MSEGHEEVEPYTRDYDEDGGAQEGRLRLHGRRLGEVLNGQVLVLE